MATFDVFNGDADGICSLQQLRLAQPLDSTLVTGVKRDIALLKQVKAGQGDSVYVMDVSLDKNRDALVSLLEKGVEVSYFDHHYPGDIPQHDSLHSYIETVPDKGTSLLMNEYLEGRFLAWAIVGTFGDNFDDRARKEAAALGLPSSKLEQMRNLGIFLNYNGYGATVDDLHFPPADLFHSMKPYTDPLDFIADDETYTALETGYFEDMAKAERLEPSMQTDKHAIYVLPSEAWARRVGGVYANKLAQSAPDRAHALLTELPDDAYVVSVRAPLSNKSGADELCRQFPTGGGRKAAAGINHLPKSNYQQFESAFQAAF